MSVRTMARVWDLSKHGGPELLLLLAIADFSDDEGNAYPAVQTLAKKCRITSRNINRALSKLKQSGELEIRLNEGPKGTNRYRVAVEGMTRTPPLTNTSPLTNTTRTPGAGAPIPLARASDEPSGTIKEPPRKKPAAQVFVLPDWIPGDTWTAYCSVRTGKRAKNDPHALGLILKDLARFRAAGHDPVEILNNSIKSGWAGVFEPRANAVGQSSMSADKKPWDGAR